MICMNVGTQLLYFSDDVRWDSADGPEQKKNVDKAAAEDEKENKEGHGTKNEAWSEAVHRKKPDFSI